MYINCISNFILISITVGFSAFNLLQVNGKAAVVTTPNPRDNAKYSHWYYKSDHHPADVPSCGKLCSKGENPECEIKDWVTNSGAEFKCTGHEMKRTRVNTTDPGASSTFRVELVCLCKRSTVVRKPGQLCGPVGHPPCNDSMTWKDGINTMIENVQGHDFLVLNHNRTQLGFGPVDSSQAAAANGGN